MPLVKTSKAIAGGAVTWMLLRTGAEPLRIDVINPAGADAAIAHKSHALQDLQMLGYGRARHRYVVGDLAHGSRPFAQFLQN
jgi:hypothetical protein